MVVPWGGAVSYERGTPAATLPAELGWPSPVILTPKMLGFRYKSVIFAAYSQPKMLGFRYSSVIFAAEKNPGSQNLVSPHRLRQSYRGTSLIRNQPPQDPSEGLCLKPYGNPRGMGVSYERGVPVHALCTGVFVWRPAPNVLNEDS